MEQQSYLTKFVGSALYGN